MKGIKLMLITLLMFISIFSIGFASWIIQEPEYSSTSGSIQVDDSRDNTYVVFGNIAGIEYTKNGFVKEKVNGEYEEKNKITIPVTIQLNTFKQDFDPNGENDNLELKVRFTLKLSEALESNDELIKDIFNDKYFSKVSVLENNDEIEFTNSFDANGYELYVDITFALGGKVEDILQKEYKLVFELNGGNMAKDKLFTDEKSPFTNANASNEATSHVFDIQSMMTVNP